MHTNSHIPSLTPLRGIAAVLILIYHFDFFVGSLLPDNIMLLDKWYLIVDLFFVLSGFIMYHVYGSWFAGQVRQNQFLTYLKARFARIYPLHFFTLLFMVGMSSLLWFRLGYGNLGPLEQGIADPKAIPTSLLLIQAWGFHETAPLNTASWSISVEFFLYLLFPWIILFLVHCGRLARWIMASLAVLLLLSITFYFSVYTNSHAGEYTIRVITGSALLRGLAGFMIGMLVYELYQARWQQHIFKQGHWFWVIWFLLFALWFKDLLPDILAVFYFGLLVLNAAYVEGKVKKVLNSKVMTYLGEISYSIYMVHMPLILTPYTISMLMASASEKVYSNNPPETTDVNYLMNWTAALLFALIVIGVASLTYRYIEVPMRRKIKRMSFSGFASFIKQKEVT